MDRYKEISTCLIGFHCFLVRGLIDVRSACVEDIESPFLKELSDGKSKRERIVFFLSAVVYRSRVAAPVSCIQHDCIGHNFYSFSVLLYNIICRKRKRVTVLAVTPVS